jgi:predicted XRE-type DNA-binding protein
MSTETRPSTFDPPAVTGAKPNHLPEMVIRIAAMTKRLLAEVRAQHLDAPGVDRLRTIDTQTIRELQTALTPDLRDELQRLTLPLTSHTGLSDSELRIAHAQLVGWLEGLLTTTQTAAPRLQNTPANATPPAARTSDPGNDIPTSPNQRDHPDGESHSTQTNLVDDIAHPKNLAPLAARRTLITAITTRIKQQRLTAAQAASLLHLTGPTVTKLFNANIDDFTLDELINLVPALSLTIQVVAEAEHYVRTPGAAGSGGD